MSGNSSNGIKTALNDKLRRDTKKQTKALKKLLTTTLLTVTMTAAAQSPQDSIKVRIGYGSGNQRTTAGAVDRVTQERMNKGLVTNSLDALSGQAAGVQVQTSVNQEAMINAVRVRGTTSLTGGNDPLVIIDGVQSNITTLSTIYPADIESFTILKDASETAQYGSRGAAGVIQVVTKKGSGERFHIAYDGNIGFESIYKNLNMLSGSQLRQVAKQQGISIIDKGYDTDFTKSPTRTGYV